MRVLTGLFLVAITGCASAAPSAATPGALAAPVSPTPPLAAPSSTEQQQGPALVAYLEGIVRRLSPHAGRPDLRFSVVIEDSEEVNAHVDEGGVITVKRGLLALLGSESEIAAVLAHEMGHAAAHHPLRERSAAEAPYRDSAVSPFPEAAHEHDGQLQADRLGLSMLRAVGYAARSMPRVLRLLEAEGKPERGTASRIDMRVARLARYGIPADGGEVGRDVYLDHIDGITFGADPRDGMVRGGTYTCLRCAIAFDLPPGSRARAERPVLSVEAAHQVALGFIPLPSAEDARLMMPVGLVPGSIMERAFAGMQVTIGTLRHEEVPGERAVIFDGDRAFLLFVQAAQGPRETLLHVLSTLRRPPADAKPAWARVRRVAVAGPFEQVLARVCGPDRDLSKHARLNSVSPSTAIEEGSRLKCVEPG